VVVHQVDRDLIEGSGAETGGKDGHVAELGIEGLAVVTKGDKAADLYLIALKPGLAEGGVRAVGGVGVAAAEGISEDQIG